MVMVIPDVYMYKYFSAAGGTRSFIEVIFVTLVRNTQIHVQPNLTHHLFSHVAS